jgi:hypothetical protein
VAEEAKNTVEIRDFQGIVTDADPGDLDDGAAVNQVNACSLVPGQLDIRRGVAVVAFEEF